MLRKRLDEQDNTTTRSDAIIPSPWSDPDPWTIVSIGKSIAEKWWPSILPSPRFAELIAFCHSQSIKVLLFISSKYKIINHPLSIIIPRVVHFRLNFGSLKCHQSSYILVQNNFAESSLNIELFNCISLDCNILCDWTALNQDIYLTKIFFLTQ